MDENVKIERKRKKLNEKVKIGRNGEKQTKTGINRRKYIKVFSSFVY